MAVVKHRLPFVLLLKEEQHPNSLEVCAHVLHGQMRALQWWIHSQSEILLQGFNECHFCYNTYAHAQPHPSHSSSFPLRSCPSSRSFTTWRTEILIMSIWPSLFCSSLRRTMPSIAPSMRWWVDSLIHIVHISGIATATVHHLHLIG